MNELSVQVLAAATALAGQLAAAVANQAVIDQAIGILRSRGSSGQEAIAQLRAISQAEDIKLVVAARRLVTAAIKGGSSAP